MPKLVQEAFRRTFGIRRQRNEGQCDTYKQVQIGVVAIGGQGSFARIDSFCKQDVSPACICRPASARCRHCSLASAQHVCYHCTAVNMLKPETSRVLKHGVRFAALSRAMTQGSGNRMRACTDTFRLGPSTETASESVRPAARQPNPILPCWWYEHCDTVQVGTPTARWPRLLTQRHAYLPLSHQPGMPAPTPGLHLHARERPLR